MSTLAARTNLPTFGRLLIVGLAVGAVAAVVNVLIFLVTKAAFSLPFIIPMDPSQPPQELPVFALIVASLVPALGAGVFYGLLGRFARSRATTIFLAVSVGFVLLSLLGPMSLPIDLGTRLVLALLHITTGTIITGGLIRFAPQG